MKKSIFQISFSMFKQILTYKCAINGVYVSLVDSKNTSKSCSKYGNIDDQSSNRMQQALLVKKKGRNYPVSLALPLQRFS